MYVDLKEKPASIRNNCIQLFAHNLHWEATQNTVFQLHLCITTLLQQVVVKLPHGGFAVGDRTPICSDQFGARKRHWTRLHNSGNVAGSR
jgi:hypothetical protein